MYSHLKSVDPEIYQAIYGEIGRLNSTLELIASENFVSPAVLEAAGCVMTNKYAEGYPGKRYYGGCEFVDRAEELAQERAKKLFNAAYVNVQPHSGAQANMAAYFSLMKEGDTLLSLNLSHGGHLSHGSPVNFSGRLYNVVFYGVDKETGKLNYDTIADLAEQIKPKVILAGYSAYPRVIDFEKFRTIADSVGAYLMADIAHIAGLIISGLHPSPISYCDIVTTTTHKTLRGPRGGMIMVGPNFAEKPIKDPWTGKERPLRAVIDSRVFPGTQGGPLMHIIAAKAVAFKEALEPSFRDYCKQIIKNAQQLANMLLNNGYSLLSGGTDNHLMLVDLSPQKLTGKQAETVLDASGITVNKNMVPFDTQSPMITSGIRIGTPAVTTRGLKETEMNFVGNLIHTVLTNVGNQSVYDRTRAEVKQLCDKFPLYTFL